MERESVVVGFSWTVVWEASWEVNSEGGIVGAPESENQNLRRRTRCCRGEHDYTAAGADWVEPW
jgi:hypothetical protein